MRAASSTFLRLLGVVVLVCAIAVVVAGPVDASVLLAQAQTEVDDGTRPMRILAIALGVLALLVGVLTWFYWLATTPPARRGYLPQPASEQTLASQVSEAEDDPSSLRPSLRDSLRSRPVLGDPVADRAGDVAHPTSLKPSRNL
ncbi:MAG: hypothetical protein GY708_08620 [Actinomycetia bacterium]|nr:hypothetical protein [Actinomycetes bacterium]